MIQVDRQIQKLWLLKENEAGLKTIREKGEVLPGYAFIQRIKSSTALYQIFV